MVCKQLPQYKVQSECKIYQLLFLEKLNMYSSMEIMKHFVTAFVLLGIVMALNAAITPLDPHSCIPLSSSHAYTPATESLLDMRVALPVGVQNQSFFYSLVILTQQERENAKIEILFMLDIRLMSASLL